MVQNDAIRPLPIGALVYTPAELQTQKTVRIATLVDSAKPAMNANQFRAAQQASEQKLRHEALQKREAEQKRQSDLVVQGLLQEMREREVKEAAEAETKADLDVQKFLTVVRAFAPILQASIEESTAAHLLKEEKKLVELKLLMKAVNERVEELEKEALKVHAEQVGKHRVALASLRLHCGNDPRAADILAKFPSVMPSMQINKKITAPKKWTTALNND